MKRYKIVQLVLNVALGIILGLLFTFYVLFEKESLMEVTRTVTFTFIASLSALIALKLYLHQLIKNK